MSLIEIIQLFAPPLAVYVGIRVDQAAMKVRLDHLERDLYAHTDHIKDPHWER